MCGIMGYVGPQRAAPILLGGLRRLEYRGYDSAGVAIANGNGKLTVGKAAGKLDRLVELVEAGEFPGNLGIGHTRWATHGQPTDANAHPHTDPSGAFAVVHNGIIENFLPLKEELIGRGAAFSSETDTEILAHLIAEEYQGDLAEAVRKAVGRARGAYALVAVTSHEPGRIVAVRMISPLVIGFGAGEMFLASGVPALLEHTNRVLILEDGELADLTAGGARVEKLDGSPVDRGPIDIDWNVEQAERGGYPTFMLKEIYEQPQVATETMSGRLGTDRVDLEDVHFPDGFAAGLQKIWVTACGTAYHAGLLGKELFEGLLRVPTEVAYAHEMRYRDPIVGPGMLTVAISQSGETADTIAAARLAHDLGSRLLAITNVVGSALTWHADDILYTRAGPEIAVASTKAYTAMLVSEYLLAIHLGRERGSLDEGAAARLIFELAELPARIDEALRRDEQVAGIAARLNGAEDIYFIGRGLDYAIAMEGSLKLKEISYLHSEAMPAGELKHGTLALITNGTPVVVVNTQQHVYDKTISGLQEVKARGAHVIAVAYADDSEIHKYADEVLAIPRVPDLLSPVVSIVPLQLLAYHVADARGLDIDQPRNLAKSVTVE